MGISKTGFVIVGINISIYRKQTKCHSHTAYRHKLIYKLPCFLLFYVQNVLFVIWYIVKAHHGFGLRNTNRNWVDAMTCSIVFSLMIDPFAWTPSDAAMATLITFSEHFSAPEDRPIPPQLSSSNHTAGVVTIRYQFWLYLQPSFRRKQIRWCFRVNYLRSEKFRSDFKLILPVFILPYAIQIGIGLQNVKMGVHCFLRRIFGSVAQAQVLQHHPSWLYASRNSHSFLYQNYNASKSSLFIEPDPYLLLHDNTRQKHR